MKKTKPQNTRTLWLLTAVIGCGCLGLGLVLSPLLHHAAGSTDSLAKFEDAYSYLKDEWYYGADDDQLDQRLIDQALSGMTMMEEDPHTSYLNLEQAEQFSSSLAGNSVGIGISFVEDEDGHMLIRQVYTNSTADAAGLQPGDEIIRVADHQAGDISTDEMVSYIKTFEGHSLELEILRDGQSQTVTVTPGQFDTTVSVVAEPDYGLITLNSFSADSGKEFTEAIGRVQASGAKNLILDLRSNSGGYVSAARTIASSLLPDDSTVFIENLRDGSQKELKTDDSYAQVEFDHIYILQNETTASASEVLIGALKDNLGKIVTTVGSTTYGKGTEQISRSFSDGTSMKYTIAEWTTPNGTSINQTGFAPDIEVNLPEVQTVRYVPMDENSPEIQPDSVGDNAAAVQVYLQYLGYPADRTDTYFSLQSSEALRQFQSDHGLEADGIINAETFGVLTDEVSRRLNEETTQNDPVLQAALDAMDEQQS